jgi:hypothetical protein
MNNFPKEESLLETYQRLKNNMEASYEIYNDDQTAKNNQRYKLDLLIFQDFCVAYTEKMMSAMEEFRKEVGYM